LCAVRGRHVHVRASVVRYSYSSWSCARLFSSRIAQRWSRLGIPRRSITGCWDVSASRIISALITRVCDGIASGTATYRRFAAPRETVLPPSEVPPARRAATIVNLFKMIMIILQALTLTNFGANKNTGVASKVCSITTTA